ncbi:MAG: PAS domain S-box protein [Bacteroidales bacterium]
MKKAIALFALFLCLYHTGWTKQEDQQKVLVIHSYHSSFAWTDNITRGIDSAFSQTVPQASLTVEFLDSKRKFTPGYQEKIKEVLAHKFKDDYFDMIILSDDDARDFMLRYGEEIFPGVPVVFCGINDYEGQGGNNGSPMSGVLEKIDFNGTMDLAVDFFPGTRQVIVVGDHTRTSKDLAAMVMQQGKKDYPEMEFILMNDMPLDQIIARTNAIKQPAIIILLPYTTCTDGKIIPPELAVERLSQENHLPLFGFWDFMFPHGVLAGKVVSGFQQGYHAAVIAIDILQGEKALGEVKEENPTYIYLDHAQLKKYDIPKSSWPQPATIVNEPPDFITRYRSSLLIILGLLVLGSIFILIMFIYQRRIKKALGDQLAFQHTLMDALPNPTYYVDTAGKIVGCNLAFEKQTGWDRKKALGQPIMKILPQMKQEWFLEQVLGTLHSGLSQSFESQVITAGGNTRDVYFFQSAYFDQQGHPRGVVGSFMDITTQKHYIETIRQNEERYALVMRATLDGIWDINLQKNTLFVSSRAKEIFGYPDHQIKEDISQFFDMVLPEHRMMIRRKVVGLIKKQYLNFEVELCMRNHSGHPIWISVHALGVFSPSGKILRVTGSISDIQRRKAMELELRRWHDIFRNTKMGIAIGEPHSANLVMVNPSFAQMHGYSTQELAGKPIATVFAHEGKKALVEHAMQKAHEEGHYIMEADHLTKDGRTFPVMVDITSVKNKSGTVLYRIVNCQDISQRKQQQKELLQQKNYISNIMNTSPVGITVVNADGQFIFANEAACLVLGLEQPRVRSMSFSHPEWHIEDYEGRPMNPEELPVGMVLATRKPVSAIRHTISVAGCRKKYLLVNAAPMMNEKGEVESVVCAIQDVSLQHQLEMEKNLLIGKEKRLNQDLRLREEELKKTLSRALELKDQVEQSENRYRDFINATGDLVYLKDHLQRFLLVNNSFEEYLGKKAGQIIGNTSQKLLPPDLHHSLMALEHQVMETSEMILEDIEHQGCKIRVRMFPVMNPNGPAGIGVFLRDITLEKQNEELRENIKIAQHSAAIKQQFLANMSHEIRTPMNGILGMIEFMNRTPLSEEQKSYIETLKSSSDTLLDIINDILDFSKIEAGKMVLHSSPVNIRQLAQNMKNLFSALSFQMHLDFMIHIDPLLPEFILTDRIRLNQILTNLISNAVKFTPQGSVTLNIRLLERENEELIILTEVTDTGIGISAENQKKLFSAFTQIDSSFTRDQEGTGLGLSICQRLVQLMGGETGIRSQEGKGSTFWFTFRSQETNGLVATSAPVKLYDDSQEKISMKILLVEDKPVNQKVVKMMLSNLGCEVLLANNGKEAIEKVKGHIANGSDRTDFDLIFMDIQMPVMDGLQATSILRQEYSNLPPIIGLSANVMAAEANLMFQTGMDDFLLKPVKTEDLRQMLLKWNPARKNL